MKFGWWQAIIITIKALSGQQSAVSSLRDFIRSYPASNRIADAQYALAEALEELASDFKFEVIRGHYSLENI